MKIGIIGAMEQEVALLRDRLIYLTTWQQAGCVVYSGQLHGLEVALVKSGIGKVFAALSTTLLLEYFKPEIVINTGSAGSLTPLLQVGDIVISHEVRYHDVDVTAFGYAPGQIPQCPESFIAAPYLVDLAKRMLNQIGIHAVFGLIVSGDVFINSASILAQIHNLFPQALAVEMEATAIAHVCYQFTVPFIVMCSISDVVNHISHLHFKKFLSIATDNSSSLVERMVQSLALQ